MNVQVSAAQFTATTNHFIRFYDLGYRRLIPIVPPGASVVPGCDIDANLKKGKDDRGKVPGTRLPNGLWDGMKKWQEKIATLADLDEWHSWGASVALVADQIVAVDADAYDAEHAEIIRRDVLQRFGVSPVRVGQAPKAIYVFRAVGSIPNSKIEFGEPKPNRSRLEIIGRRKQFVLWGPHQKTGRPYSWPRDPVPFDELLTITAEGIAEMMAAMDLALPNTGAISASSLNPPPPQKNLLGSPDLIIDAMKRIPNRGEEFESREDYLNIGYALRGGMGADRVDDAKELFLSWCSKWEDGEPDADIDESNWRRMTPPVRLGAEFLYDKAFKASEGAFNGRGLEMARKHHKEVIDAAESAPSTHGFNIIKASSFEGLPIPQQRWLVKDIIPAQNVTMLAGDGATGKSLIAVQLGAAHVTGTLWLGCEVERGRALFFTAEDEMDELHRRLVDICRPPAPFSLADLDDLHLVSFNGMDAVMAAPLGKEGLLGATPIFKRLRLALEELRPTLLFLDTQADLFGGDENKRIHARQFIGMLQGLAKGFETTVILLSHPSLSGMSTGSGMSGNTAWNNSVRSRLYLSRRFEKDNFEPDPDVRVLITKKANRARNGGKLVLRYSAGRFVCEGVEDDTPAADRERTIDEMFLTILDRMTGEGRPVSHKENANNFAPAAFEKNPLAKSITTIAFQASMERLFASGAIKTEEYGPPSKRYKQIARAEIKPTSNDLFGE